VWLTLTFHAYCACGDFYLKLTVQVFFAVNIECNIEAIEVFAIARIATLLLRDIMCFYANFVPDSVIKLSYALADYNRNYRLQILFIVLQPYSVFYLPHTSLHALEIRFMILDVIAHWHWLELLRPRKCNSIQPLHVGENCIEIINRKNWILNNHYIVCRPTLCF